MRYSYSMKILNNSNDNDSNDNNSNDNNSNDNNINDNDDSYKSIY